MAYGTDGALAALGLVIMEDPKGIQPIYAPTSIIRADTLAQYPRIKDVLAPVFRSLDTPTLQALNAKVALEGQDAKQVSWCLPQVARLHQVMHRERGSARRSRPRRP